MTRIVCVGVSMRCGDEHCTDQWGITCGYAWQGECRLFQVELEDKGGVMQRCSECVDGERVAKRGRYAGPAVCVMP